MTIPNRLFGQTMKKKQPSRYQRQFGGKSNAPAAAAVSEQEAKAAEAAARRRLRQEQGEAIDAQFGYHRLEDQVVDPDQTLQRRGWLYHMLATTVRYLGKIIFACFIFHWIYTHTLYLFISVTEN